MITIEIQTTMKVSNGSPAIHESSWRILAVFQEEQQSGRIHPNSEEYKIQTVRSSKTLTNLLDVLCVVSQ